MVTLSPELEEFVKAFAFEVSCHALARFEGPSSYGQAKQSRSFSGRVQTDVVEGLMAGVLHADAGYWHHWGKPGKPSIPSTLLLSYILLSHNYAQ